MKHLKVTTLILSTLITFTSVTACMNEVQRPEGAVDITQEEIDIIETMQAEGAGQRDISEALIVYENVQAASEEPKETEGLEESDESVVTVDNGITSASGPESVSESGETSVSELPEDSGVAATVTTTTETTESTFEEESYEDDDASDYCEFLSDVEDQVIQYINEARKQKAVECQSTWYCPIVRSQSITDKCHIRCYEIIDDFSHNSSSGTDLGNECIYRGTASGDFAYNVYRAWFNSAGHRSSMLCGCVGGDQRFDSYSAGVGILRSSDGYIYAVYGLGNGNEGTPPSSGYVLAEGEHMHHYDIYVRTEEYGTQWLVVYACECGDECGWIVDENPEVTESSETEPVETTAPTIDPDEIEI